MKWAEGPSAANRQSDPPTSAITTTYLISISMYVMPRAPAPARFINTKGFILGNRKLLSAGMSPQTLHTNTHLHTVIVPQHESMWEPEQVPSTQIGHMFLEPACARRWKRTHTNHIENYHCSWDTRQQHLFDQINGQIIFIPGQMCCECESLYDRIVCIMIDLCILCRSHLR